MPVIIEKNAPLYTVIIDRPEAKNAVDRPTAEALADAFAAFDRDDEFSVAILCGAGGTFCAGADLKAIASEDKGRINRLDPEGCGPMGPTRMQLGKPVIAAVSGYAVAGGMELALWCDLRVMEETATMGVFCRRFGVPLIDGGTVRLPRLVGMSHALDLIMTGRPVDAKEAKAIGLANRIVPHDCARQEAEKLALEIAQFPQQCLRHDRLSAYEQWNLSAPEALANEFNHGMIPLSGGESASGAGEFARGKGKHGKF